MTFLKRLISTVFLLLLFAGSIFLPYPWSKFIFTVLALIGAAVTPWEMTGMLEQAGYKSYRLLTSVVMLICTFLVIATFTGIHPLLNKIIITSDLFFLLFIMIIPWTLLLSSNDLKTGMEKVIVSAGTITLLQLPIIMIVLIYLIFGPKILLFFILMTKIGDIGAYAIGTLSNKLRSGGNHKMFPVISPGKSYEGCIGGLIISIIGAIVMFPYTMTDRFLMPVWAIAVLGAVMYIGGAAGDLAESVIKRACAIKDSGKLIPGIGGVFDLLDSLLLDSLVFWLFVLIYSITM